MNIFVRAVVTGFGVSLGNALFKKVAKYLHLDEPKDDSKKTDKDREEEGGPTSPVSPDPITES